jgi:ubiquinone/menaquinone biosynthesis C-methylase UbiE
LAFPTSHTTVEAELLARALPENATVLEAGCGRTSRLAQHRDRITRLVGVDLDAAAGGENPALDEFIAADLAQPLPFPDEGFDLVYANFVIEHLERPEATFREWRRVLRPGGGLVFLTSNTANPYLAAARLLPDRARVVAKRVGPGAAGRDVFPARYRANTPKTLTSQLASAGFEPVELAAVATLHRYAGGRAALAALLRGAERVLPTNRRSTMVGWFRRTQ